MPEGKFFWLKSHLNGLCLDLSYGKAEAGNDVITWEYRGADNQLWYEDRIHGVIRSKLDDSLVLEEKDDDYVMVNKFDPDNKKQKWITSVNRVCRKGSPKTVLSIRRKEDQHGALLKAKDFDDEPHQKWDIVHVEAVYCVICTADGKKALDITGCDSNPGAVAIIWDRHGETNQQWYEDKYGIIRSRLNLFAIDTSDEIGKMQPFEAGNMHQSWVKAGNAIRNMVEPDMCLQIKSSHKSPEVPLLSSPYEKLDHQKWKFEYL